MEFVDFAEFGEDGARFDEFVEEVVVGCGVWEECVAGGDTKGEEVHEGGGENVDVGAAGEVRGVGGEEAHQGEEGAP